MPLLLAQPHGNRLGDLLNRRLQDRECTKFQAPVAYAMRIGVIYIADGGTRTERHCPSRCLAAASASGCATTGWASRREAKAQAEEAHK